MRRTVVVCALLGACDESTPPDDQLAEARLELGGSSAGIQGFTFDSTRIGVTARATFTLANSGDEPTGLVVAQVTGDQAFDVDANSGCVGAALDPTETCDLTLTYAPVALGEQEASLLVAASPGGMISLGLGGSAAALGLTFEPTSVDFGEVEVGPHSQVVRITNMNSDAVPLTSISVNGPVFSQTSDCGASLPAGGSCDVTLQMSATQIGSYAATLTVDSAGVLASTSVVGAAGGRISVELAGAGSGTVVSTVGGIDCGTTCSGIAVTQSTLTATPSNGSVFLGWSEPSCGSSLTCVLPADSAARTIDATFALASASTLMIDIGGAASGEVGITRTTTLSSEAYRCTADCAIPVAAGDIIELAGISPHTTSGWTGACVSAGTTCSFTVTGNQTATINFSKSSNDTWSKLFNPSAGAVVRSADFDSANRLVIGTSTMAPPFEGSVLALNEDGTTRWAVTAVAAPGNPLVSIPAAGRVRLDASNNVYLLAHATLAKLDADGVFQWSVDLGADADPDLWQIGSPFAVSPNGDVAVQVGQTLKVFTPAGTLRWSATSLTGVIGSVAIDAQGNIATLHPTQNGETQTVYRFSPTGTPLSAPENIAPQYQASLAFDSQNNFITASSGHSKVYVAKWLANGVTNTFTTITSVSDPDDLNNGVAVGDDDQIFSVYNNDETASSGARGFTLRRHSTTGAITASIVRPFVDLAWYAVGPEIHDIAVDHLGRVAVVGSFIGAGTDDPVSFNTYAYVHLFTP